MDACFPGLGTQVNCPAGIGVGLSSRSGLCLLFLSSLAFSPSLRLYFMPGPVYWICPCRVDVINGHVTSPNAAFIYPFYISADRGQTLAFFSL